MDIGWNASVPPNGFHNRAGHETASNDNPGGLDTAIFHNGIQPFVDFRRRLEQPLLELREKRHAASFARLHLIRCGTGWKTAKARQPASFISRDGFAITDAARDYLAPLIHGEAYPDYRGGLPRYVRLKNTPVPRRLKKRFRVHG